ncbi:MAG: iron response transcriptional regulator IrrA [Pseudomonadota bacterium]
MTDTPTSTTSTPTAGGCSTKRSLVALTERLREAGLRPTRQRLALSARLFANGDRHATAEMLHEEVVRAGERVSLATVYNTLHQFKRAGLLRELTVEGAKTYFDTNTSDHSHYFDETTGAVMDIPVQDLQIERMPTPPEGYEISHIDVVVRLRKA